MPDETAEFIDLQVLGIDAQRAVEDARAEAEALGHPRIGTEHLLLGILKSEHATAARVLGAVGADHTGVWRKVREARRPVDGGSEPLVDRGTARAARAVGRSVRFSKQRGTAAVTPEDLLIGVLDVEGTAGQILRSLGVDVADVLQRLDTSDESTPASDDAEERATAPTPDLEALPEDWARGLAVVAHPDDMEYGAASAVARWTRQGKEIAYVLVTDGEAGISTMPPEEVGPLRRVEQVDSCRVVGVDDVGFLGFPDGAVVEGLQLRAELAAAIRRHRPHVVLSINFRDSWGGPSWNHADHRAVGRALLDAVRDAANPWSFPDRGEAWDGVRFVAFSGSPQPTHAVDVTDTIDVGVESLLCHHLYLRGLGGDIADAGSAIRRAANATGPRLGVEMAAAFELIG